MTAPTIIRCSGTDRTLACPPSLLPSEAAYNPGTNPDAMEGRAGHAAMAKVVMGEIPDLDAIAAEYGVDLDELTKIVSRATYVWLDGMVNWFPEPDAETKAEAELAPGVILRGTRDVGSTIARAVNDWKFGWDPSSHTTQVKSYAYLMRADHGMPESGFILGIEYWVRPGELKVHRFDDAQLDQLREDLLDSHSRRNDGEYGPSTEACRYCPRQNECTARADWARSGVSSLTVIDPGQMVTRAKVAEIYARVEEVRRATKRFDALVHAMLLEGDIDLPDGRTVSRVVIEQIKIQPSKALAVLAGALDLDDAQLDHAVSVTKSGLDRALNLYCDKGRGAAAVRWALEELEGAGAVSRVEVKKKKVIKGTPT